MKELPPLSALTGSVEDGPREQSDDEIGANMLMMFNHIDQLSG